MRLATTISLLTIVSGCHLALGLDDIDPGDATDDDDIVMGGGDSTSTTGAGGTGADGGSGGTSSTGGTTGVGGDMPNPFRGPPVGNYLLSGRLAGSEAPEFYVTVTESSPDGVSLTSQPLDAQSRTLVGTPTAYDVVPNVLPEVTEIALGVVTAPAEANPVAALAIVAENVVLELDQPNPPCGTLRGNLVVPFMQDLTGSTFFMTAVSSIDDLPANPPFACP